VTGEAIFVGVHVASIGVVVVTIAWQHGWNRGVDAERRRGRDQRTFWLTLRHQEPLIGTQWSTYTVTLERPVTDERFRQCLDQVQRRLQAHHRPEVVAVVELDPR